MKRFPQINRFFTAVCSIIILSLSFSCEKDSFDDDSALFLDQDLSGRRGIVREPATLIEADTDLIPYLDCATTCIEPETGAYYYITDGVITSGQNSKEVSYLAYNTETDFVVEVVYNMYGNSNAHADITISIDGNATLFSGIVKGSRITHSIPLDPSWSDCELIPLNIYQTGGGSPIDLSAEYALVSVCQEGCEESFDYRLNDQDGSYTFTYISEEDLTAAEVKFTCPHIVSYTALDGKTYSVNPGNGNGAPTVLTWNGDINACEEITFTIAFEADCGQNNANFATIWTDFKVNDDSKKGDLDNIVFECD